MRVRTALLAAVLVSAGLTSCASGDSLDLRPNVVVIMTDDQTVESMRVMPNVRDLLAEHGVTFTNSFASYPLCCPSRATLLTGQYAHNHGVLGNEPPNGGYGAFEDERTTLPVALQDAGYTTIHIGKYLNRYGLANPRRVPPAWDDWRGLVGDSVYEYLGFTLNNNGALRYQPPERGYQTDVLTRLATDTIRRESDDGPFFLNLAYVAPHRALDRRLARPAARHQGTFATEPLPMPASFNEADASDKPPRLAAQPPFTPAEVDLITRRYRSRLESLLAVDEGVAAVVRALRKTGELDNTLIVFTSDNGFLQGEHRVASGKVFPYEPSIRVPLVVRGLGVASGAASDALVANVDLAPTILAFAGAESLRRMDGRSLEELLDRPNRDQRDRPVLLEAFDARSGAYQGVRTRRYVYVEYTDGGRELYDLRADPDQLENRAGDPTMATVEARMARTLARLRDCAGGECR
ncbi:MAG: sulfatase [Actinobacteria bacterium]|nr:sulfatase [Actinomycetota bacterium]